MECISLWQPWASLIAAGVKTIETRSWAPPPKLIGRRIAIHAGKRRVSSEDEPFNTLAADVLRLSDPRCSGTTRLRSDLPRGGVVATAVLSAAYCVKRMEVHEGQEFAVAKARDGEQELLFPSDPYGDFSPGRWLWILDHIEPVEFVEVRGAQRFFHVDDRSIPARLTG